MKSVNEGTLIVESLVVLSLLGCLQKFHYQLDNISESECRIGFLLILVVSPASFGEDIVSP